MLTYDRKSGLTNTQAETLATVQVLLANLIPDRTMLLITDDGRQRRYVCAIAPTVLDNGLHSAAIAVLEEYLRVELQLPECTKDREMWLLDALVMALEHKAQGQEGGPKASG